MLALCNVRDYVITGYLCRSNALILDHGKMFLELVHEIDGVSVVAVQNLRSLDRVEGGLKIANLVREQPEIKLRSITRRNEGFYITDF